MGGVNLYYSGFVVPTGHLRESLRPHGQHAYLPAHDRQHLVDQIRSEKNGLSEFRKSAQANGNIVDLQGRIISCQHAARNIIRIEKDGRAKVLADKFDGKRFNSPNDVAVRHDGTLWFTDPPWGLRGPHEIPGHWVYKLDPATGKVEVLIKDLAMPNGIVFSPDGSRLYVADTGGN